MNIDEFIEHTQETAKKHRYHADFFDINNPMRAVCIKSAEDCEQLAEWLEKFKEYQHLEEQDRLVKLPCKDVYHIVDINNPKYAMVMKRPIRELAIYEIEDIDKALSEILETIINEQPTAFSMGAKPIDNFVNPFEVKAGGNS